MGQGNLEIEVVTGRALERLRRIDANIEAGIDLWLLELGEEGLRILQEEAPVKTGETKETITMELSRSSVRIYPTTPYAVYVEFGAKPHRIEGKPLLTWLDPETGRRIWAKHVEHPGIVPNPFVARSRERFRREVRDRLIYALKLAVKKA